MGKNYEHYNGLMKLENVKIEGRTNLWSEIDCYNTDDEIYCLMENDTWGDEAGYIAIKLAEEFHYETLNNGKKVIFIPASCEICETWDDIETALRDEDII